MSLIDMGILKGRHCVLDTDDMVTECIDNNILNKVRSMGIIINQFSKLNLSIGLISSYNNYSIFIGGNPVAIFGGSFPKSCKRNDLFGYDIKIVESGIFNDKLYIVIIANCWCKYDIEVPLFMCQVLSAPITNIKNMNIACITREPIYISTKSILRKQYEQCFGDFPNKALESKDIPICISKEKLQILGVVYKSNPPIYDVLDDKLPYFCI